MRLGATMLALILSSSAQAATAPAGVGPGWIDFNIIPSAHSIEENRATWAERTRAVLWAEALREFPAQFTREGGGSSYPVIALARFEVGHRVEETNRVILEPRVKPYSLPGTDFHDLGKLCAREGDYDFGLRAWMPLLYRFWDRPDVLWPETRAKILHVLATEKGAKIEKSRFFCGIPIPETENHILMTETSQLLTNQLLNRERIENGLESLDEYNNDKNGMNRWMRAHLAEFLKHDFDEFNSRPYQPYAIMPIQNLYEFASDDGVREAAKAVLDYLSAKFAASNSSLRRLPPFCRQAHRRDIWEMLESDGDSGRMLALTGYAENLADRPEPMLWNYDLDFALYPLLGTYRLPRAVESRIFEPIDGEWQRFQHGLPEVYARIPGGGLISGGGVYKKAMGIIKADIDPVAMPTVVIPAEGAADGHDLIRFEGHKDYTKRSNLCVGPGFACGMNPVVPTTIPEACKTVHGNWTFFDFTAPGCAPSYRLWVALYQQPCDSRGCRKVGESFGFLEAQAPQGDFQKFVDAVLHTSAGSYTSEGINAHVLAAGHVVEFTPLPGDHDTGMVSWDGEPLETDWRQWNFAEGDLIRSAGMGWLEITGAHGYPGVLIDTERFSN